MIRCAYEIIDEAQIKDIMEGREPRPPEDWDDSIEDPKQPNDGPIATEADEVTGGIGGTAQEH